MGQFLLFLKCWAPVEEEGLEYVYLMKSYMYSGSYAECLFEAFP